MKNFTQSAMTRRIVCSVPVVALKPPAQFYRAGRCLRHRYDAGKVLERFSPRTHGPPGLSAVG